MENELKVVGKATSKIDANIRVSGRAIYGNDLELPGMLHGAILRTKYPKAKLNSINTTKAKALPGVVCVITADDVDVNLIGNKKDHPVLKKGAVRCIRDEIAAVAAVSREIALKALNLIEVEYTVEEGIFDPWEALKEEAPKINPFSDESHSNKNIAMSFHYEHGDLEAQKKKSAVIVQRRYQLPRVTHCCLGTTTATADYSKFEDRLTLYTLNQVPFLFQRDIADTLKMAPSKIRVVQSITGGAFGSKLDVHPFEPICALLSMKTGHPVQITYSREEEFLASPTRQTLEIDLTTGADEHGRFTFREVKIIKDNGAYTSWGATNSFVMMQTFSSLYQTPACLYHADAVYTNNPFAGSFRGYGNPQATFALERNIDVMAEELGMDKGEIRLLNANFKGEVTGQGLQFNTCGLKDALETVLEQSCYSSKKDQKRSGRFKRGIGLASMLHVGGGAKIYPSDGCGTTVKLDSYGYLTIITGSSEIGQGSETVLAMIGSEELGIEIEKIRVINTDTDIKPWDVGVHASRTSFVAGNSLLGAIEKLKKKLSPAAAQLLKTDVEDLEYDQGLIQSRSSGETIPLDAVVRNIHFKGNNELCIETYFYEPDSVHMDKEYKGNVSGNYAFASQAIEVEVDTYTGKVRVLDAYVAQDVGRVLNPLGLQGQIEGGLATGIGYALTEELIMENGYVMNPNFHDYKLLTASDMPNVHFYPIETFDSAGPYGAKGVSEAPLIPTAPAIANAISNAIGKEIMSLPITPEKVLRALKNVTQ